MLRADEQAPELPDISDVFHYLENNPVMLSALQEFLARKEQVIALFDFKSMEGNP